MRLHLQSAGMLVLLLALTGCGLHRKPKPVPVAQAQPPDLRQSPLYSPELGQNDPNPPTLPGGPVAKAQPAPPAQPEPKKRSIRHPKATPVKPAAEEGATAQKEASPPAAAQPAPAGGANTTAQAPASVQQAVVKASVEPEASGSAIGQLTAGTTPDAVETKRETVDLIQSAEKGVQDLKRSLSSEEKKAVTQIKSFLQQAQRALDNGDTDGAHTLATKAKVMLDELSTGS